MVTRTKAGGTWRVGTQADVAWIVDGTRASRTIAAAVPPVFDAYATVPLPTDDAAQEEHDRTVIALLSQWAARPWWLGYLDTGADDLVFPDAPTVTLYAGWSYVLVEAGPEQAATWRREGPGAFWKGSLPNLVFPADRSWLYSVLWDDDHASLGGPAALVDAFARHPVLHTAVQSSP